MLPPSLVAFLLHNRGGAKFSRQDLIRDLAAPAGNAPSGSMVFPKENPELSSAVRGTIASGLYCPLVYLPASLGIWVARTLNAPFPAMMYAARILDVLVFVAALAISFHLAPGYRALMTGVALLPMTLQQVGGVSADVVTIAISFIGLSLVLHAREYAVDRRFLILIALVFTLWGLCKSSIWAAPLLLLVPVSAFRGRLKWLVYITAISLCMVGTLVIWNALSSQNLEALRASRLAEGVDIAANVRVVAAHPLAFALHVMGMIRSHFKMELGMLVGTFGWTMFALPVWARALYLFLLAIVAVAESSPKPFLGWERGVLSLTFLAGVLFVHAAMCISDTTLCAHTLSGVCEDVGIVFQGRYLIPFCLAGFLILQQSRVKLPRVNLLAVVTGVGTLHALASLALIWSTYHS
jgi:uncharacterized membrane protein